MLEDVGFHGRGLQYAWAVAMKESHGNPVDYNFSYRTQDNSYGLFQINLYGALKARIAIFHLSKASELKDPVTNAQVAYQMSNGGNNWSAWKSNPGQRDYWVTRQYISKEGEVF